MISLNEVRDIGNYVVRGSILEVKLVTEEYVVVRFTDGTGECPVRISKSCLGLFHEISSIQQLSSVLQECHWIVKLPLSFMMEEEGPIACVVDHFLVCSTKKHKHTSGE